MGAELRAERRLDRPERRGEGELLRLVEPLIGEDQDRIARQRRADRGGGRGILRHRQIEIADLGDEVFANRVEAEFGHAVTSKPL